MAKWRDILPISPVNLPDAMLSLIRRSLITKESAQKITRFTLQLVMRQYLNRPCSQRRLVSQTVKHISEAYWRSILAKHIGDRFR
ncbi:hypothetical protein [Planktothricoides raciborskii]|uniref:hypothetical protein n=1 Tax=Planktothricoides raciborskii TaxID=132608 RepID=UPI001685A543|nr:hypothetical protein [Planktothricoides raciborskii]